MFKSQQKILIYIALLLTLMLFVAYKISFSDTFDLVKEVNQKQEKLLTTFEKQQHLKNLQGKLSKTTNSKISKIHDARDFLTNTVSEYCQKNSCQVIEIPIVKKYPTGEYTASYSTFVIKGSFQDCTKLVWALEKQHANIATIVSLRYLSRYKNTIGQKIKELTLTIHTKSVQKQTKET